MAELNFNPSAAAAYGAISVGGGVVHQLVDQVLDDLVADPGSAQFRRHGLTDIDGQRVWAIPITRHGADLLLAWQASGDDISIVYLGPNFTGLYD